MVDLFEIRLLEDCQQDFGGCVWFKKQFTCGWLLYQNADRVNRKDVSRETRQLIFPNSNILLPRINDKLICFSALRVSEKHKLLRVLSARAAI